MVSLTNTTLRFLMFCQLW